MGIFERRVPLSEEQMHEVRQKTLLAGRDVVKDVVGNREILSGTTEEQELQQTVQSFLVKVGERAGQRGFFTKEERADLVVELAEKIEAVLLALQVEDRHRLDSFVSSVPQTVEETLRSFARDISDLEEELARSSEGAEQEELQVTKTELEWFRDGLWQQVKRGDLRMDDRMSSEERQAFAKDVVSLEGKVGVEVVGKSTSELANETAEAMVDEYHRMLVGHLIFMTLEASYSREELQAHLKEVVPEGITIDLDGIWKDVEKDRTENHPKELSKLQIYGRVMKELFSGHTLTATGFSAGTILLGYLAPQMAGQFGDFGRSGKTEDAVEGAGFGMVSSLAQVELSRRLSLFLHGRLYAESGLASKILYAVIQSSPELFSTQDRALVRQYVQDAIESIGALAQQTIEGLGTHLAQTVGLAAASVTRLHNPALFGPVLLAAGINTFIAKRADRFMSEAQHEVRQASAQFTKRFDEAMEVRAKRGGGQSMEREIMERLKLAQDALVNTAAKYQQGGGLVMPLVLLLNAMLMDRGRPDFFADYAEGSMYSMQLSQSIASLTTDVARIGQAIDPIFRLLEITKEFHEGGHVVPELWDVEFVDVHYKKLSLSSLHLTPGEIVTVVGESGSGKSTLLELLYGFTPDRGLVFIDDVKKTDVNMRQYRDGVAVANQFFAVETASFIDNLTGKELPFDASVFTSMVQEYGFESWMREISNAEPSESIESIGQRLILNKDAELSGGELKKFALFSIDYRLRVLPDEVKMILLDEPTSGADPLLKQSVFRMIQRLRTDHPDKTIVIVNHDYALYKYLPEESRILGVDKQSGILIQDETLSEARRNEGAPFLHVFHMEQEVE